MADEQTRKSEQGNPSENIAEIRRHLTELVTFANRSRTLVDIHLVVDGEKIMEKGLFAEDKDAGKEEDKGTGHKKDPPNTYIIEVSPLKADSVASKEVKDATEKALSAFQGKFSEDSLNNLFKDSGKKPKEQSYKIQATIKGNKIELVIPPTDDSVSIMRALRFANYVKTTSQNTPGSRTP